MIRSGGVFLTEKVEKATFKRSEKIKALPWGEMKALPISFSSQNILFFVSKLFIRGQLNEMENRLLRRKHTAIKATRGQGFPFLSNSYFQQNPTKYIRCENFLYVKQLPKTMTNFGYTVLPALTRFLRHRKQEQTRVVWERIILRRLRSPQLFWACLCLNCVASSGLFVSIVYGEPKQELARILKKYKRNSQTRPNMDATTKSS